MKFLIHFYFYLLPLFAFSNAAAPGMWGAGGAASFSLLYPEDSALYSNMQMVKEKVSIELYKGYAVVKGEYWMFNHSDKDIVIRVGYPLNSDFAYWTKDEHKVSINFDKLYQLKAVSDHVPQKIISEPVQNPKNEYDNKNWYIWHNSFHAKDTTLIEVYFIVNTNETDISKGYNRDHRNGFIYVLESGATWKQPIVQGEVRIRLMDDLVLDDVHGISPDSIFNVSDNILVTYFSNLTPTKANNIIVAYADNDKIFDFSKIVLKAEVLYRSIDEFSNLSIQQDQLSAQKFGDPFEVHAWFGGFITGLLMFSVMVGVPLLGIGLIVFIVIKYWK